MRCYSCSKQVHVTQMASWHGYDEYDEESCRIKYGIDQARGVNPLRAYAYVHSAGYATVLAERNRNH